MAYAQKPIRGIVPYLERQKLQPGTQILSESALTLRKERDNYDVTYYHSVFLEPHQKALLDQLAARVPMCG